MLAYAQETHPSAACRCMAQASLKGLIGFIKEPYCRSLHNYQYYSSRVPNYNYSTEEPNTLSNILIIKAPTLTIRLVSWDRLHYAVRNPEESYWAVKPCERVARIPYYSIICLI